MRLLEDYIQAAQSGPLKTQALQFVIWEELRAHKASDALRWATQLRTVDAGNALALALIADNARNATSSNKAAAEQQLKLTARALSTLPQLSRPLGLSEADFSILRQQSQAMLKGAAGAAELQLKNYAAARLDLRDALAFDPNDTRNVYALALADLDGKDRNAKEGYWYLARAVDLSQGTPQGTQIASYARNRYLQDGGSNAAWDQFLAATAPSGVSPQPKVEAAASKPVPQGNNVPVRASATSAAAAPDKLPGTATGGASPAPSVWADDTPYNPPVKPKHRAVAGGPLSLGILIETSITSKENRAAFVNGLTDMLRHLGDNDEAFVLTYDNNLVFETDLTADPHQLEQALADIKPQKGAVLDDAVAFAAGHLARIAKNPNRVLLIISDGRNIDSQTSPLRTSAEIHAAGVKIYCIGVGVDQVDGRYRLQALSSSTGGHSDFISDTSQFRHATQQIAQNMGIDFKF